MSRTTPTTVRRLARASAVVFLAASVAGCSGPEPSDLESPDVIWPTTNPTSQWDDSPYVDALRDGFYEVAIAWNGLDFSDVDLVEAGGYRRADAISRRAHDLFRDYYYDFDIDEGADPSPYLVHSPSAFSVVDLYEEDDVPSALIDICSLPETTEYHEKVEWNRYRVTLHEDGTSTIEGDNISQVERDATPDPCKDVQLELGQFDPAPEPVASPEPDSIRMPLPPEAYE